MLEICDMERIHFHLIDRDSYFISRVRREHIDDVPLTATIKRVIESPAPMWFVSYEYAYFSLSRIQRGGRLKANNIRNRMLHDLYEEVMKVSQKDNTKWTDVLLDVICSPAPRLYITLPSARILFYKLNKKKK